MRLSKQARLLGVALLMISDMAHAHPGLSAQLKDAVMETTSSGNIELHLKFNSAFKLPQGLRQQNPNRLIWDLPGVQSEVPTAHASQQFDNPLAKSLRIIQANKKTRVVLDLNQSAPYSVRESADGVIISLVQTSQQARPGAQALSLDTLRDFQFKRGVKGQGRLSIKLNNDNPDVDFTEKEGKITLTFQKSRLPSRFKHRYDVQDFATPFKSFEPKQQGDHVVLEISSRGKYEKLIYQLNDEYIIELAGMTQAEQERIDKQNVSYNGKKLSLDFQNIDVRSVFKILSDFTGLNIITSDGVTGTLTLNLQNVPWDQALDIILDTKNLDMRKKDNVVLIGTKAELAAHEKATLESNQAVKDLAVLHSDLIQLNYAKASEMATMLKDKTTSLLSSRGNVSVDVRTNTLLILESESKLTEIRALLKKLDRPVRQVEIETQIVTASDSISEALGVRFGGAAQAKVGKRTLGIGSTIERSRSIAENVGGVQSNNDALAYATALATANKNASTGSSTTSDSSSSTSSSSSSSASSSSNTVGSAAGQVFPLNDSATDTPPTVRAIEGLFTQLAATGMSTMGKIGLSIAGLPRGTLIDVELQAMEAENLTKVLSRPKLRTMDQIQATVEQGVSIPYQQSSSSGASAVSFAQAALKLDVTPHITPDDHISLDLKINNDTVGTVYNDVPSINTNRLATQVLVDNGETVVLGGIFQLTDTKSRSKVPFFGDLPLIGSLFKRRSTSDTRQELLIFVTPRIVQQLEADEAN